MKEFSLPPAALLARQHLGHSGFDAPGWSTGSAPRQGHRWPFKGWQRLAAHTCDKRAFEMHLADLTPASRARLLSQAGPFAARAFNITPARDDVTVPSAPFRVRVLRRLWLPVPLAPRSRRGQLEALGDHRTACATSGVFAAPSPAA